MSRAVYLTGVPGTGKSAVAAAVATDFGGRVLHFSYSEHLGRRLQATREQLRAESATMVTAEDVAAVDGDLQRMIDDGPKSGLVIIDSHAVTYETYGFRVVPFTPEVLQNLRLQAVVCLSADPLLIVGRVAGSPDGRRTVDQSIVEHAQRTQEAVATSYALQVGVPLHIVDASPAQHEVVAHLSGIVSRLHTR